MSKTSNKRQWALVGHCFSRSIHILGNKNFPLYRIRIHLNMNMNKDHFRDLRSTAIRDLAFRAYFTCSEVNNTLHSRCMSNKHKAISIRKLLQLMTKTFSGQRKETKHVLSCRSSSGYSRAYHLTRLLGE
ncbi:unnamed protein product [Fusarium graminearum]|nr:unnamed protein product [Fusarium graminearum]CAG1961294.1 unnamed protein product [Fusarium graminearum]VTO83537.1 unnamed protein product [Fusarium graminearum]